MSSYRNWNLKELRRWQSELEQVVQRWDACRQQKPSDPYYEGMYTQTARELSKVKGTLERRGDNG